MKSAHQSTCMRGLRCRHQNKNKTDKVGFSLKTKFGCTEQTLYTILVHTAFTLFARFTLAPLCKSHFTTERWPQLLASCSKVSRSYQGAKDDHMELKQRLRNTLVYFKTLRTLQSHCTYTCIGIQIHTQHRMKY